MADRRSRRRWAGAFGLAAAALIGPRAAGAQSAQPKRIAVLRAPGAEDCPDARALAASVNSLQNRQAVEPVQDAVAPSQGQPEDSLPGPSIEIEIQRDRGYVATLKTGARSRQIDDPGPTCAGLADALALTVAILLDVSQDAAPTARALVPLAAPTQAREEPTSPRLPSAPPPPVAPRLSARLMGGLSAGLVETAPVFEVAGTVRLARRLTLAAGGLWIPSQAIEVEGGEVDVWLVSAMLRGCVTAVGHEGSVRASGCGVGAAGLLRGSGKGFPTEKTSSRPWFALGLGAEIDAPVAGPVELSGAVTGLAPLRRERFELDAVGNPPKSVVAFDPPAVGVSVEAGIAAALW